MFQQSFLLDYNGLDTVLFYDQNNLALQLNWMQWNSRQRLYYQDITTTADDIRQSKNALSIYPNPANTHLNFLAENNFDAIIIYSVTGEIVKNINVSNQRTYKINTVDLDNGFYFYKVKTDKDTFSGKFVVLH